MKKRLHAVILVMSIFSLFAPIAYAQYRTGYTPGGSQFSAWNSVSKAFEFVWQKLFATNLNNMSIPAMKGLLWIVLWIFIGYMLWYVFKKKNIAIGAGAIVSAIPVIALPAELIRAIFNTYGVIASFILLAIPVAMGFWLRYVISKGMQDPMWKHGLNAFITLILMTILSWFFVGPGSIWGWITASASMQIFDNTYITLMNILTFLLAYDFFMFIASLWKGRAAGGMLGAGASRLGKWTKGLGSRATGGSTKGPKVTPIDELEAGLGENLRKNKELDKLMDSLEDVHKREWNEVGQLKNDIAVMGAAIAKYVQEAGDSDEEQNTAAAIKNVLAKIRHEDADFQKSQNFANEMNEKARNAVEYNNKLAERHLKIAQDIWNWIKLQNVPDQAKLLRTLDEAIKHETREAELAYNVIRDGMQKSHEKLKEAHLLFVRQIQNAIRNLTSGNSEMARNNLIGQGGSVKSSMENLEIMEKQIKFLNSYDEQIDLIIEEKFKVQKFMDKVVKKFNEMNKASGNAPASGGGGRRPNPYPRQGV